MRKIAVLSTLAVGLVLGFGAVGCSAPASDSVATQVVHPKSVADLNAWATDAVPIITDISLQTTKLADNPLDQVAGAALDADAAKGMHLAHTSGSKDTDARWKSCMAGAHKIAADVRAYDMGSMSADANTESVRLEWLDKSIPAR